MIANTKYFTDFLPSDFSTENKLNLWYVRRAKYIFYLDSIVEPAFVNCYQLLHTAVWARNIEWELLNGKTLLTLFAQNDQFIMTFFDCTMNVRYVGGTWWSPSNYWWWLLVISTPLPNCGGYAAEIHHFTEVMRWQKHILGRIGCTKMQFELRFNSLQFWIF